MLNYCYYLHSRTSVAPTDTAAIRANPSIIRNIFVVREATLIFSLELQSLQYARTQVIIVNGRQGTMKNLK